MSLMCHTCHHPWGSHHYERGCEGRRGSCTCPVFVPDMSTLDKVQFIGGGHPKDIKTWNNGANAQRRSDLIVLRFAQDEIIRLSTLVNSLTLALIATEEEKTD